MDVKVGRLTAGVKVRMFESVKVGVTTGVNVWAITGEITKPIKRIKYKNLVLFIISHFNLVAV